MIGIGQAIHMRQAPKLLLMDGQHGVHQMDMAKITSHPTASTTLNCSSSGNLRVAASSLPCIYDTITYQWYSNTTNSNTNGTLMHNCTGSSTSLPATFTAGMYYFFCEVRSGKDVTRSNVAKVTVSVGVPVVSSITGPSTVASGGSGSYEAIVYGTVTKYNWLLRPEYGTVQFNVSNLPKGNYLLHIYDGVSSKPEIQQIMVQR